MLGCFIDDVVAFIGKRNVLANIMAYRQENISLIMKCFYQQYVYFVNNVIFTDEKKTLVNAGLLVVRWRREIHTFHLPRG